MTIETMFQANIASSLAGQGISATFTHGAVSKAVQVFFQNPYFGAVQSGAEVESSAPYLIASDDDIAGIVHRDTFVISGTTYYAIGIEPNGKGLTRIALSRD